MALQASGAIAFSDVNVELGFSSTATIALNDQAVRTLFGIASGAISMSDGYSKSAYEYVDDVFSVNLYTGSAPSATTVVNGINLSGKGGLVWLKVRNQTYPHFLTDTARGVNNVHSSNSTAAQENAGWGVSAFNSNGFTTSGSDGYNNALGNKYLSWTFRKSAKFFDIVTWTGNGTGDRTISHNLGSTPGMIIMKTYGTGNSWFVYHRGFSNPDTQYQSLNETFGTQTGGSLNWNVTSTTFQADANLSANINGETFIAYLFAHNAGGYGPTGTDNIISCGSFSTPATVDLGWQPQWVLFKITGQAQDWFIMDATRGFTVDKVGTYNYVQSNNTGAEGVGTSVGLGLTNTGFSWPFSGTNYIYTAIRKPFKPPTVGTSVFKAVSYTGNGSTQTLTAGFPVDGMLVIDKSKTFTLGAFMVDRYRGAGRQIYANDSTSELTDGTYKELDNNVGLTFTGTGNLNGSGYPYIAWFFKRATKFFDVAHYVGTGTEQIISHNLGAAPEIVIAKDRSAGGQLRTYWAPLGSSSYGALNDNGAMQTYSGIWGTSAFTSTTFRVGTSVDNNVTSNNFIAWLFATCPGVSKVGSYTGTGALQTVDCGFTTGARFVLIKRSDSSGGWYAWDSVRGISSGNDPYLVINEPYATEVTNTNYVDTDSTGFKVTAAAPAALNASGGTYIFLAIA